MTHDGAGGDPASDHGRRVLGPLDQVGAGQMINLPQVGAQRVQVPHTAPIRRKRIAGLLTALRHDERMDARVVHRDGPRFRGEVARGCVPAWQCQNGEAKDGDDG